MDQADAHSGFAELGIPEATGGLTRRKLLERGGALAGGLAIGPFLLSACGSSSGSDDLEIAFSQAEVSDNLDPAVAQSSFAGVFCRHLYDQLVTADDSWNVRPELAERWRPLDGGATWEFEIRDGVKFHDGQPLTTQDVAYTLRRLLDKKTGSGIYGRLAGNLDPDGVVVVDKARLRLNLRQPDVSLPLALATRYAQIVQDGTTDFKEGNGTGPFTLESFIAGESGEIVANDSYWRPDLPHLRSIRGRVIGETVTKIQSVTTGSVQMCDSINASDLAGDYASNAKLLRAADSVMMTIAMDATAAPFDDNRVRSAVKLATDRERILKVAYRGHGSIAADTPVPASDPFFPSAAARERDVEGAKRLLAEAGHPNGLELTLYTADAGEGMVDLALTFAEGVEEAGIQVRVEQRPADTYFDRVWLKEPMFVDYWSRRHPSEMLPLVFTKEATQPEGNFKDPRVDELTAAARAELNDAKRRALYSEALTIIANSSGLVIPLYADRLWMTSKNLEGAVLKFDDLILTEARLT